MRRIGSKRNCWTNASRWRACPARDIAAPTTLRGQFYPSQFYSYLIAYRPGIDPLQILAIVHGARDVHKVLKQRDL
jgi:hypothetical protein